MLTESDLRQLIARGEQLDVEFIGEEREPLSDRDLVEAVVCLANGRGGTLLIGVEDDGRVTGARPRHGSYTDVRRLGALIEARTVPSCPVECVSTTVDGRTVLAVTIPAGRPVTSTSGGLYLRRALDAHGRPHCLPLLYHDMLSREADRGRLDRTAAIVPEARWEDLDPLEIERLRQTVAKNPARADASLLALPDEEIVKALGLGIGSDGVEQLRLAALLLLGREEALRRLVPTHEVAFQVLAGTRVTVNDFFTWPLIKLSEELGARFAARNQEQEMAVGLVRVGIPDYSPAGFREAVHNALIHRDYGRLGAVHVQWRDGEVEVANPGGFVEGVTVDTILVATPQSRNPLLANAFKRIGLVERTGRGVDTIFEGQLRYGRPAPDYSLSTSTGVKVVLRSGPPKLALARLIVERDSPAHPVTVDEMLLLNAIEEEGRIDAPGAARLVQKSEGAAQAILERLVAGGVLEARRDRRDRIYQFSASTARALGVGAAAARGAADRARMLEPARREELILQYVDAHGRITRSQAAELCQIGGREARAVLEKLVKRAELVVRGERRGSYYERPAGVMTEGAKL